ncbi:MAG TPA: cupin domain-containing protein [Kofleriaceae bacterium]|jgi:mannose-6-phosphate isomerase-like protein (cupin superfamily)|nr:cupin domain-containing protein [Kofleriaceae bacterium]
MNPLLARERTELTPAGDELYMIDLASEQALAPAPFQASWWTVVAGSATEPEQHAVHEIWIIEAGSGELTCGETTMAVRAGDVLRIPPHTRHVIANAGPDLLTVYSLWWG